ncbi:MAG: ABC transporter ATP-binding protein [Nanoarchaeota archaeon]|nr:ABC transporter ATP-binding protein [Nanoarchaeota archaeon]
MKKIGPLVSLRDVWKIYKMGEVEVPALQGVTVDINPGEFVAIIGQSGSGKSTMMNMVGCLDMPTKGAVFLKSFDISTLSESDLSTMRGKSLGFIFQQYNLIQNMTAFDNVMLPLEFLDYDDSSAKKKTRDVLELVGLTRYAHHLPTQMSGGQQQRVSIARSLVTDPEIILADEPTGALDSITGREVIITLQRLWKKENKTVIMVTHDMHLAQYAEKHIELKDGRIISVKKNDNIKIEK